MPQQGDEEFEIFLDALTTYADACTLPRLTPSCPYYDDDSLDGPTCGEQCHDILDRYGVERPRRQARVDGLIFSGRAIPKRLTADPVPPFDAWRTYITESLNPPGAKSTTTLLIGLLTDLKCPVINVPTTIKIESSANWSELVRRGHDVRRIILAAVLRPIAFSIGTHAAANIALPEAKLTPQVSSEFVRAIRDSSGRGWPELLDDLVTSLGSPEAARNAAKESRESQGRPSGTVHDAQVALELLENFDASIEWDIPGQRRDADSATLAVAGSRLFRDRVEAWLGMRFREHFESSRIELDLFAPPSKSVFMNLPTSPANQDEVGLWIWERFTVTDIASWSDTSLWRELHYHSSSGDNIPARALAERTVDSYVVSTILRQRTAERMDRSRRRVDWDPRPYIKAGREHLRSGKISEAIRIFSAIVDLRPNDAVALNCLGFALLASDPLRALRALQQASADLNSISQLNSANRVLAFHCLGRDQDALEVAGNALASADAPPDHYQVWLHDDDHQQLELVGHEYIRVYIENLRAHIVNSAGSCFSTLRSDEEPKP